MSSRVVLSASLQGITAQVCRPSAFSPQKNLAATALLSASGFSRHTAGLPGLNLAAVSRGAIPRGLASVPRCVAADINPSAQLKRLAQILAALQLARFIRDKSTLVDQRDGHLLTSDNLRADEGEVRWRRRCGRERALKFRARH